MNNDPTFRSLQLAGLEPLIVTPESNFINIGERTNVTGSRQVCASHPRRTVR